MSGYLCDLVARTLGAAGVVEPRLDATLLRGSHTVDEPAISSHSVRESARAAGRSVHASLAELPAAQSSGTDPGDGLHPNEQPDAARAAPPLPPSRTQACEPGRIAEHAARDDVREVFDEPRSVASGRAHVDDSGGLPDVRVDFRYASDAPGAQDTLPRGDDGRPNRYTSHARGAQDTPPRSDDGRPKQPSSSVARNARDELDETPRVARELASPLFQRDATPGRRDQIPDRAESPPAARRAGTDVRFRPAGAPARARTGQSERADPEATVASEETVVNVTIGRIEVRAPSPTAPKAMQSGSRPAPAPRVELEAYLRNRHEARK